MGESRKQLHIIILVEFFRGHYEVAPTWGLPLSEDPYPLEVPFTFQAAARHGVAAVHRRMPNTTNMLERLNRELKKSTKIISIFSNEESLLIRYLLQ
jgi:hypothetical protein